MKNISAVQEPIWLTQNIYTKSTLYNVGGYAFIEGELQESILMKAIEEVLQRIDVIEIGYHAFNESTLSDNVEFAKYDIGAIDFSDIPDPAQSCLDWIHGDMNECFDVSRNLLKVRLFKSSKSSYYWYTKVHHFIFDGYSMALFFNNVSVLYSKYISNDHGTIANDVYQYSDFIDDGNEYKFSDYYKSDRVFWLNRLSGLSGVRAFQSCMKSNKTDSLISKRAEIKISRELYNRIDSFCKSHNCTVFHYFISSLFVLNRCYNNEIPLIGLPVFNRRNKKFKNTFGTFVNMLPFSVLMKDGSTFLDILYQVKSELRDCYKHQRFPLYDVLQELDGQGNIYNITFSYQKNSYETRLGNSFASINYIHSGEQQEDLVFHLLEYSETADLTLSIDYRSALFSADVITNLLSHFNNLLYSLVNDLNQPINELNYLSEQEKHQLLVEFNATIAPYALNKTVVDLFEEQVLRTPDAIGLMYEERSLSYRELNDLTNRLAHYLRQVYDVSADDLIGIRQERSEWIVISLLAVLKSGGAYVPIDPFYPQDRIDYIIADSNCKVVLDEKELDKFRGNAEKYSSENPVVTIQPTNLAYIIYTSGSTGRPKGVMIMHSNVYAFMQWCKSAFSTSNYEVVLGATSVCFDLSVFEMFYTLVSGKQLRLLKDALSIPQYLNSTAPLLINTVPSVVNSLLNQVADWSNVTVLNMAGEPISPSTVCQLDCDRIEVRNLYGPSEDTTYSTVYRIKNGDSVLIGHPISNTRIYILNDHNQLQPLGVAGEICISGAGLGRGYLNQEALTSEKFVPHPFIAGERLYKTGDLGKWQSDGNIMFLGRKDNQVKIRGYRIEPGEIEHILQQYVGVKAAIVTSVKDNSGDDLLVAYIVLVGKHNVADIRHWLGSKLPHYMLPAYFIELDSIPLLPNGKLNKKALPKPEGRASTAAYVAARNHVEEQLVQIWQEILGKEQVGIKDNFFELGGHSLKVTRLASQVYKLFEVKLAIKELFSVAILEEQARLIAGSQKTSFVTIPAVESQSSYPLSSSQRRLWILSQFEEASVAYNMPGVFEFEGTLDIDALSRSFDTLIERHESLRTVFRETADEEIRQYILSAAALGFKISNHDLCKADEATINQTIQASLSCPFDLENGPLLRADIYQLGNNKWIFSYVMHHIISDGWSMEVLIKELLQLYNAYTQGLPNPLTPLRLHYKNYAVWQQQQLTEESYLQHKRYWLQQLGGELPVLDLPTDKVRSGVKTYNGASLRKQIDPGITKRLKALCQSEESTLFIGLLSLVKVLLYRYTSQEDIIVGSPVAGREHSDLEDQIGFYVNTLALRTQFNGADTYQQLLSRIKQTTLDAYAHQAYPFDALVSALDLQRDLSRSVLFDVLVVLQHESTTLLVEKGLMGLQVSTYEGMQQGSKFDLQFNFVEVGDQLELYIHYNKDIYDQDTITQLLTHLEQLLAAIIANPATPVARLNYLSAATRQKILSFNKAIIPATSITLTSAFKKQAGQTPDNIALVFGQTLITYRELDEESDKLAGYLRNTYQSKPGELIGIKLERSEWMIIALLGVLKSGAAFVPIDPAYPPERVNYILSDSQCKLIIDETVLQQYRIHSDNYRDELTTDFNTVTDLAYVIYTSGSTGRPKGVMIPHGALHDYITAIGREYGVNREERILQVSNFSFDAAIEQIMLSMLHGASLYVISQALATDTAGLTDYISANDITHLHSVPTLLQHIDFTKISSLKRVVSAGEDFPLSLQQKAGDSITLYNKYGPTEATISATLYKLNSQQEYRTSIPIGHPLDNSRVYILNDHDQLQPDGIVGEICIGGNSLAQGYLNQPELTAAKFTGDPYYPGKLIYRTGDLGKWQADGNIVFLGRKDDQVKIRGHRIELGEITQVLMEYSGIATAVVAVIKETNGDSALAAYVVCEAALNAADIRNWLASKLPYYMVPVHFVQLDALPLLPNGKLNRKALPVPQGSVSGAVYEAPRNEVELQLVQIWQDILGKEQVGIKDNFFELGGHSLHATRLAGRIYKVFGVKIALKDLFSLAVLEGQALLIAGSQKTGFTAIPVVEPQSSYPLSSSQRRLWILCQFEESSIAYNMPGVFEFEGVFDIHALSQAFDTLIERHESLRTLFHESGDGEVEQYILTRAALGFHINYHDLRNANKAAIMQAVKTGISRPFDLSNGPLIRADVYQSEDNKWVFSYVMHHIIGDGWSMGVLIKELLQLYNSSALGTLSPLSPLRIQYKDYAAWQQKQLNHESLRQHREYWVQQLSGELPVLDFPTDKQRPAVKTYIGASFHKQIDTGLVRKFKALCHSRECTLFMGLMTLVKTLLHRYCNQSAIIIGSPIAGREHSDLEDQIGFYVNTLALRTQFSGRDSFQKLLSRVKQTTLDAYAHQSYPFDALISALDLQRDMSRSALFDVMVVLQHQSSTLLVEKGLSGLQVRTIEGMQQSSKFDLQFNFVEVNDQLELEIIYNNDLYYNDTIIRLFSHLEQLLASIVAAPGKSIGALPYLSLSEQTRLLETFNNTSVPYEAGKTIIDWIEEQVLRTPDSIGLMYENRSFSYRELNETANRLAHYLKQTYEVSVDDLIGIQQERSEWLVISLLAVLKSGGAYVPIDPAYPQDRIDYIIADSQCKVVLNEKELNGFRANAQKFNSGNPAVAIRPADLAYIMYTSGSTGHPKGVMITHSNVSAFMDWCKQEFGASSYEVVLGATSICFDLSVFEIFYTLASGKQLRLLKDALSIPQYLNSTSPLLINTVPGVVSNLLSEGEDLSNVSVLNMAGEPVPASIVQQLDCNRIEVRNLYGPSEDTTYSTVYRLKNADPILIGHPISNTRIYILNDQYQLQPVGVVGEICISGAGLARGYLNKEELTSEKFVPHPFIAGERMYKTGDLGKWQPDGNIGFLGRKDDQVKIRGFRIELGEISHSLQQHASVKTAVVTAIKEKSGDNILVAYVVGESAMNVTELRNWLGSKLPHYMVPAHFVQLDALPLLPNGKLNRKALPVPESQSQGTAYVAPRTGIEIQLAQIWQEILGLEKVGLHHNFFELGGHSLKATRLASQVHKVFDVKIALKDLFRVAVLEDQAALIGDSQKTAFATLPAVQVQPSYALSSSQRRLWVLSQFEEGSVAYNMPAVFELTGTLDIDALSRAFDTLIMRHEILRTVFRESADGEIRQTVLSALAFCINKHDLQKANEATIKQKVRSGLSIPFDLANGPLLRADIYQSGDNKWLFSYVMHHIISDGWSMGVLINELLQLYSAFIQGKRDPLQPLSIHYKEYAAWQQQQLTEESFQQHRKYWLQQLSGEIPVLELPTDKIRPAVKTYNGASLHKVIDAGLTRRLKALCQSEESTLFMGLLAAVNTLLYRYTSQEDIIIGSPIAGREHSDLEDQIGFYVNTLALRTQFNGAETYQQLLSRVKQTTLDAYAHQAYPFDALMEDLDLQRDLSRNALFDVMVVLQHQSHISLETALADLQIRNVEELRELSKFDLQFNFIEEEDTIGAKITYNTDIYHHDMMVQLLNNFEQLLERIIANPDKPIAALKYLDISSEQMILGFNKTTPVPAPTTVIAAFKQQVANTPDNTALVFEQTALTYRMLDAASDKLGIYLRNTYQLKPGELIGIMLDRSEWMIIALLGILKAGAAFVPIDPVYPQERIDYIISDSNCRVVIDKEVLNQYFTRSIAIKGELADVNTPDHLAYVIYTSGSTGRPKGVMIPHGALNNYITGIGREYGISNQDRILQVSNFAFDAAIEQIMLSMCNGAALYVISQSLATNTDDLSDYIGANKITHLHSVPVLLQHIDYTKATSLRRVVSAGEDCPVSLPQRVSDSTAFYNKYGPTEATISATLYRVSRKQDKLTKVPIGHPLNNSHVYILNDHDQLQPVGVAGEICIGGHSLAQGYLNQPDLTATKFINDPYQPGQLIYRTGDLGKWLPDGNIVFIGRKDDQVKIRGHRIELGEITKVLEQYKDVESAVVTAFKETSGDNTLVAYLVNETQVDISDLRNWLGSKLPHYMIPAHFIQLDALPLLPNGKLNKKALPAPEATGAATPYVAPRNEIEMQLAQLWQQVLGLEQVGVQHNFFELGGHSLNATRLVSQVQKEFGVNVNIKDVFLNPTIETVGALIRARLWLKKSKNSGAENRMLVEI